MNLKSQFHLQKKLMLEDVILMLVLLYSTINSSNLKN